MLEILHTCVPPKPPAPPQPPDLPPRKCYTQAVAHLAAVKEKVAQAEKDVQKHEQLLAEARELLTIRRAECATAEKVKDHCFAM
eukprot:6964076-Alexandrium_andersonii.AAC.1